MDEEPMQCPALDLRFCTIYVKAWLCTRLCLLRQWVTPASFLACAF